MRVLACALAVAALCLGRHASVATAQGTGPRELLSEQGTLRPRSGDALGFTVPLSLGRVDVTVQTSATNTTLANLVTYCNPGYGSFLERGAPQPGNAVWSSNLSSSGFTIPANDPNFSNDTTQNPYFVCSVINNDAAVTTAYEFIAAAVPAQTTLVALQQQALLNIFESCCNSTGSCVAWRAKNVSGATNTNFCSFPAQSCSTSGMLSQLNMSDWDLNCTFPSADLSSMTSLESLDLTSNPNLRANTSDVWQALATMPGLTQLKLINDSGLEGSLVFAGADTGSICDLRSLKAVDLSGMQLRGSIPPCLLSSTQMVSLSLDTNTLEGTIPDAIVMNTLLQRLSLKNNRLSGPIPPTLAVATRLTNLDLSQNLLNGTISPDLGVLPYLMNFVVVTNRLTGSLPSSLLTGRNIRTIDVKENMLTELPNNWLTGNDIPENSTLVNLRISFNQFQGQFPRGLTDLPNLMFLVINSNTLSGPLPDADDMFPALRALNVSNNQFTGTIPAQLSQTGIFSLPPLMVNGEILRHKFDLSSNRLNGSVPAFLNLDVLQPYVASGIYLAGNNFLGACREQLQYIQDICSGTPPPPPVVFPRAPPSQGDATMRDGVTQSPPPQRPPFPSNSGISVATQPPAESQISSPQTQSSPTSSGISGGAIAGIVVGAVAAIALILGLALLATRCRGGREDKEAAEPGRRASLHSNLKSLGSSRSGFSHKAPTLGQHNGEVDLQPRSSGVPSLKGQNSGLSTRLSNMSLPKMGPRGSGFERYNDDLPEHPTSPFQP